MPGTGLSVRLPSPIRFILYAMDRIGRIEPGLWVIGTAGLGGLVALASWAPLAWAGVLVLLALAGLGFLVWRHTIVFCVAWLLIAGMTIEMTVADLAGLDAFQPTIAGIKAAGLVLALTCAVRWGWQPDPLNPAWAFTVIAMAGLATGLYPGLTPADSLRSWIGSIAPFAFCFCRPPRVWADAMLTAVRWCPVVAVAAAMVLSAACIRPMFVDSGGLRLAGIGHPAFLAGVALTAVCACLIELFRTAGRTIAALLGANLTILLLTGARAPLAYAAAVIGLSLAFVPSAALSPRTRGLLVLCGLAMVPVLFVLAGELSDVRIFHLLQSDATNLSGRDRLWPAFEAAAEEAPVLGWGTGSGNLVLPPDGVVAKLLRTWAAHNEYLRIRVEGGWIGLTLLIGLFTVWAVRRSMCLGPSDRGILRLSLLAFAALAATDNVLISTPACVTFTFAAALFVRGEHEHRATRTFALPDSGRVA